MRTHWIVAVAMILGCGAEDPDESVACRVFEERWETGGRLEMVSCRRTDGSMSEEAGVHTYAMELEADLRVLEDTQIFPTGSLVHKSGPEGRAHRRPAGEVVTVREEVVLVETEDGWLGQR